MINYRECVERINSANKIRLTRPSLYGLSCYGTECGLEVRRSRNESGFILKKTRFSYSVYFMKKKIFLSFEQAEYLDLLMREKSSTD